MTDTRHPDKDERSARCVKCGGCLSPNLPASCDCAPSAIAAKAQVTGWSYDRDRLERLRQWIRNATVGG